MGFCSGPTLLLLMTLSLLSAEDADNLEVRYPQATISVSRGSAAKLSCEAYYDFNKCGVVHVVWHKEKENENAEKSSELSDPDRYFTTVNETIPSVGKRRRQVVTEIQSVKTTDNGRYQCKAACEEGESAMGHYITIIVKGRP